MGTKVGVGRSDGFVSCLIQPGKRPLERCLAMAGRAIESGRTGRPEDRAASTVKTRHGMDEGFVAGQCDGILSPRI